MLPTRTSATIETFSVFKFYTYYAAFVRVPALGFVFFRNGAIVISYYAPIALYAQICKLIIDDFSQFTAKRILGSYETNIFDDSFPFGVINGNLT